MKMTVSSLCLAFIFLLAGCRVDGGIASVTQPVQPVVTKTSTLVAPAASPTQLTSDLLKITNVVEPPALTAIPTFTSEEAIAEIQKLMLEDEGCAFPCWWFLTPGQTLSENAKNFLNQFSIYSVGTPMLSRLKGYIRLMIPQDENLYLSITFSYETRKDILDFLSVKIQMMRKVTDDEGRSWYEISWGNPQLAELTNRYSLAEVLFVYGKPTDVMLFTYQAGMLNQPWPISLVLFYPDQGFMIEYVADGKGTPDSSVGWCSSLAFPIFWFWNPSKDLTMSDVISDSPGEQLDFDNLTSGRFRTLEDASGMSVDEFYRIFKTNEYQCVETPIDLWPMPGQ